MNEEELAAIRGQQAAMGLLLTQLISHLPPVQAAQAAVSLAIEREAVRNGADYATPETEIATTEALLDGYLALLSAVAQHGR